MSHNLELLASERHADRYRGIGAHPAATSGGLRLRSARDRAAWLLIGIGLRLLAGRGHAASHHRPGLIGQ